MKHCVLPILSYSGYNYCSGFNIYIGLNSCSSVDAPICAANSHCEEDTAKCSAYCKCDMGYNASQDDPIRPKCIGKIKFVSVKREMAKLQVFHSFARRY